MQKMLQSKLFIIPFVTKFLQFHHQSYTLDGSLFP